MAAYEEMDVRPVTLEGRVARLEPLAPRHAAGLLRAGDDPDIWHYMPVDPSGSLAEMERWVEEALAAQARGTDLPFAIVRRDDGAVVGSTRYLNIARRDRGLEIGWTWLGREARRTAMNTECKYLLLRHAFEELGAIRVQLKTDLRNERSQRAIERIGAVREGVLRKHMIVRGGHQRDTVMYSVIDTEWPAVRARLEGWGAGGGEGGGGGAVHVPARAPRRSGEPPGRTPRAEARRVILDSTQPTTGTMAGESGGTVGPGTIVGKGAPPCAPTDRAGGAALGGAAAAGGGGLPAGRRPHGGVGRGGWGDDWRDAGPTEALGAGGGGMTGGTPAPRRR